MVKKRHRYMVATSAEFLWTRLPQKAGLGQRLRSLSFRISNKYHYISFGFLFAQTLVVSRASICRAQATVPGFIVRLP